MAILDKTRKMLWGRSGSLCAFCRRKLIEEKTAVNDESIVGDEAHIHSEKEGGPRYDPLFPKERIDSYENLLLLCKIHHKQVDDQPETFTADILRQLKSNHELWVSHTLQEGEEAGWLKAATSAVVAFERVEATMPALISEMRADLEKHNYIREFVLLKKTWMFNEDPNDPVCRYYFEDHEGLQGKIQILENHGFLIDVTSTNVKRYRMREAFVDLLSVKNTD
jgi:HNH endonuclease